MLKSDPASLIGPILAPCAPLVPEPRGTPSHMAPEAQLQGRLSKAGGELGPSGTLRGKQHDVQFRPSSSLCYA